MAPPSGGTAGGATVLKPQLGGGPPAGAPVSRKAAPANSQNCTSAQLSLKAVQAGVHLGALCEGAALRRSMRDARYGTREAVEIPSRTRVRPRIAQDPRPCYSCRIGRKQRPRIAQDPRPCVAESCARARPCVAARPPVSASRASSSRAPTPRQPPPPLLRTASRRPLCCCKGMAGRGACGRVRRDGGIDGGQTGRRDDGQHRARNEGKANRKGAGNNG